jgi:hypothetical protein
VQGEPEVDDVIPYWAGKRYILCGVPATGQYGIWDGKRLDRQPGDLTTDWNTAWATFATKEPNAEKAFVRCPTCRSRWVFRISRTDHLFDTMEWGVASAGLVAKTFRCTRCTYTW